MSTLIHKIEFYRDAAIVRESLWGGPVPGVVEIAKKQMPKWNANFARVLEDKSGLEIWAHDPDAA